MSFIPLYVCLNLSNTIPAKHPWFTVPICTSPAKPPCLGAIRSARNCVESGSYIGHSGWTTQFRMSYGCKRSRLTNATVQLNVKRRQVHWILSATPLLFDTLVKDKARRVISLWNWTFCCDSRIQLARLLVVRDSERVLCLDTKI